MPYSLGCPPTSAASSRQLASGEPKRRRHFARQPPGPPRPGTEETASRVLAVGQKIVVANPQIGLRPTFATVAAPHPEIFHHGGPFEGMQVFISEGLVNRRKEPDAELAALLCLELGKIVTEREGAGRRAGPAARETSPARRGDRQRLGRAPSARSTAPSAWSWPSMSSAKGGPRSCPTRARKHFDQGGREAGRPRRSPRRWFMRRTGITRSSGTSAAARRAGCQPIPGSICSQKTPSEPPARRTMKALHCPPGPAAALLIGLVGCKSASGKPKVAFVSNNPEAFWNIAEAGATRPPSEAGVELLFRKPPYGDAAVQKEEIDTVLNQGVKAIAISVIDPEEPDRLPRRDRREGAAAHPGQRRPRQRPLCYIGTDNYEAGRAAGKLVKEAMPDGGTSAIFVGQLERLNARQRARASSTSWPASRPRRPRRDSTAPDGETYGKYKLFTRPTPTSPRDGDAQGRRERRRRLTVPANENLCMVGLWAYNPPAILTAVKDKVKARRRQGQDRRLRRGLRDARRHQGRRHLRHRRAGPVQLRLRVGQDDGRAGQGRQVGLPGRRHPYVPHAGHHQGGRQDRMILDVATFRKDLELSGKK